MTDQPVPDRSDDLTTTSKLDGEDPQLATGTGDPATTEAGQSAQDGQSGSDDIPAGDAPKPSPDI